jgi:hypothetical protein
MMDFTGFKDLLIVFQVSTFLKNIGSWHTTKSLNETLVEFTQNVVVAIYIYK